MIHYWAARRRCPQMMVLQIFVSHLLRGCNVTVWILRVCERQGQACVLKENTMTQTQHQNRERVWLLSQPQWPAWVTAGSLPYLEKQAWITEISSEPSRTRLQTWDCKGIVLWIVTSLGGDSDKIPSPHLGDQAQRDRVTYPKPHTWPAWSWVSIQLFCEALCQKKSCFICDHELKRK